MPSVRLFVLEADDVVYVETPATLAEKGVSEGEIAELFTAYAVELNTPTFGIQEEAKRRAQVADDAVGFRIDPGLLAKARAECMVKQWPGWSWPDFESLPPNVANVLDAEIQRVMYPASVGNAGFFEVWRRKLQSSQAETQQQGSEKKSTSE